MVMLLSFRKSSVFASGSVTALLLFILFSPVHAENIHISNIVLLPHKRDTPAQKVQFDIAWNKSWRNSDNFDAAWVFIKYSVDNGKTWEHGDLTCGGINPGGLDRGAGTAVEIIVPEDTCGAFIQRSAPGRGDLNTRNIIFPFLCRGETTGDIRLKIKLFAVEMVYIPEGTFYAGDPRGPSGPRNCFYTFGKDNDAAYRICSEQPIDIGTEQGDLYYDRDTEFSGDWSGPIPADFPKGYAAFYLMKYEVTQGQYRDFLNTLTARQQRHRCPITKNGSFMNGKKDGPPRPEFRNGIQNRNGTYVCNLTNDAVFDSRNDGDNIPCNWVNWTDLAAFADWAGLRPMTELELEKACRGPRKPFPDEYPWGTLPPSQIQGIINMGTPEEQISPKNADCAYGNHQNVQGPVRSGLSAAGYWGNTELAGNLWERAVTVGTPEGRKFDGRHGNGQLDKDGFADVRNWPGKEEKGSGFRGGSWRSDSDECLIAERSAAAHTNTHKHNRYITHGIRCARTAPK